MKSSLSKTNYSTKPLAMADRCKVCRYYESRNGWSGQCRRRPPVVTPGTAGDKCFPIVKVDDWCGAFEGAR